MNKNYGKFGIGKQTAVGAAAVPTTTFLASADSDGIDVTTSSEAVSLTNGMRDTTAGRYISSSEASAKVTTLAFADFLGLLLLGALGKVTSSGAAKVYTHAIKMGESLPYLTFAQQVGSSDAAIQQLSGCKVDSFSLSAEGIAPPKIETTLKGCDVTWLPATTWTGPAFDASKGWFITSGADVLFSLTSGEPVAIPVGVDLSSVAIKIENSIEASPGFGRANPLAQTEKSAKVTAEISGTTDSTELYRKVKTGSASGTKVAPTIVTGALQIVFKHSVNADWTLTVKMGAIPWAINAMSVSTDGGPFALTLSTDGAISVDGTSIEFILVNDTASY